MDDLLPVLVVAFAFSMVSERLANLIKLYLPSILRLFKLTEPLLLSNIKEQRKYVLLNLHLKQEDQQMETLRARIIALISLIIGCFIAGIFADEICGALAKADGLGNIKEYKWGFITLGFGVLFSFGSKFWHDLLDIVLLAKNVRRRIEDIDIDKMNSASEIQSYLQISDQELLEASLITERSELEKTLGSNIRRIDYKYQLHAGKKVLTAIVYLEGFSAKRKGTHYMPLPGSRRMVPLVIVGGLGPIQAQGRPGEKITVDSFRGTFGGVIYRDGDATPYIITCGHNVTKRDIIYSQNEINSVLIKTSNDNQVKCQELLLKDKIDLAFLKPAKREAHENIFDQFTNFSAIRQLLKQDESNKLPVYFMVERRGRQKKVEGQIKWYTLPELQEIMYDDGKLNFQFLIAVENPYDAFLAPTESGDSGTICYDRQGRAIGIVTGSDNRYTYLQSLYRLSKEYEFSFNAPNIS